MNVFILGLLVAIMGPATVTADPGLEASCGSDHNEPNNQATQARMPTSERISGRICKGDEDWFRVQAKQGETITVQLHNVQSESIMPRVFSGPNALPLDGRRVETNGGTKFEYLVRKSGILNLRLSSTNEAGQDYSLRIQVSPPPEDGKAARKRIPKSKLRFLID